MSVSSCYTGGHIPGMGPGDTLASPFLPVMFTSKATVGPDSDGRPWGPPAAPHLLQQLRAEAEGSRAAPLFSPTPITFAEVLRAPGTPLPCTPR